MNKITLYQTTKSEYLTYSGCIECLQLKTKISKIEQMNWWKRIVFIFKEVEV